jgi:serine/threonine protein kinase
MDADSESLAPGQSLGPYRLEELLGEGAVGLVFRARREPDGEVVALKVLRAELSGDDGYRRRFAHEARAAQEVENSHLVPILDAGEADGRHFLAVRYVGGPTLEERIKVEGPLPSKDIARVTAHVGTALDALHGAGLIHRDVKPSNVLFDEEGRALLTDFGLAKGPAYTVLTRTGQVVGTLDYLAPELIRGQQATAATDIYALGCVVYECVSGQPPFGGKGLFEVSAAHLEEEPPDPCANRPDLPQALGWAVLQALTKDPEERPPTGAAFAHMVRLARKA